MDENEEKKVVCDILDSLKLTLRLARSHVVAWAVLVSCLITTIHLPVSLLLVWIGIVVFFTVIDVVVTTRQLKKIDARYKQFAPQVK